VTPLLYVPVVLSALLLAAHFFRAGHVVVVVVCLALLAVLPIRRRWAGLVVQFALAIGALEWARTLAVFAAARASRGEPYGRLVIILGSVALFTGLSALIFSTPRFRRIYPPARSRSAQGS